MAAQEKSPEYPENVTGKVEGPVSGRASFLTQAIEHIADSKHCMFTATAQRFSRQSERKIEFKLERSIESGTYTFNKDSEGPVSQVSYYEHVRTNFTNYLYAGTVVDSGTLVLKVSDNKDFYSGKLTFTSVSRHGLKVDINVSFEIYLPFVLVKH